MLPTHYQTSMNPSGSHRGLEGPLLHIRPEIRTAVGPSEAEGRHPGAHGALRRTGELLRAVGCGVDPGDSGKSARYMWEMWNSYIL